MVGSLGNCLSEAAAVVEEEEARNHIDTAPMEEEVGDCSAGLVAADTAAAGTERAAVGAAAVAG